MRSPLLTLTAAAIVTGSALFASPASAWDYRGVDSVTYHEATDACITGQALPCTTNAGHGNANVLRIVQHDQPGSAGLEFDATSTTSLDQGFVWMAATIAADCKAGYDLSHVSIEPHDVYDQYKVTSPDEVTDGWGGINISYPDANSMPTKKLALNIPIDEAFDPDTGFVHDFDSLDEVYAHGEQIIDQRIAAGMNEAHARSLPFTFNTWVVTHAYVRCSGASRTFAKRMPRYLPLQIQFVPVAEPTSHGRVAGHGDLTFAPLDTGTDA